MSKRSRNQEVKFRVNENMKDALETIAEEKGLSVAEIGRRGLLHEIEQLKGDL